MALLSGMRVLGQKAFGDVPVLKYDNEATKMLRAEARTIKPISSKCRLPVDLSGDTGVWASMIDER